MTEPSLDPIPTPVPGAPATGIVALGRRFFAVRGWIYPPIAVAALLLHAGESKRPEFTWPAGLALVIIGIWLRFSCILRMGGAARTHKHKAKKIVDTGPYGWVRNPLYIANTAAFVGFIVLCDLPGFALGAWLFLWGWYHAIARYEETVLAEQHPAEFVGYRARVPLWIPRPPKDPEPEDPADFYPVPKLLKRERGALLNVAVMVALAAGKQWWWNS